MFILVYKPKWSDHFFPVCDDDEAGNLLTFETFELAADEAVNCLSHDPQRDIFVLSSIGCVSMSLHATITRTDKK